MMKKMFAILLALMLILTSVGSLAELATGKVTLGTISINGAFTLQCGLPEGYAIETLEDNKSTVIARIYSVDPQKPLMILSVAFDETYADVDRMNDLNDEELALLEKTFTDNDPTIDITYGDTGLGTRLLIAKQVEGENDYVSFLSIYKGYFVEFVLTYPMNAENRNLSDEDLLTCIDFLTDLDFVPSTLPVTKSGAGYPGMTVMADLKDYEAESNTMIAELRKDLTLDPEMVANLKVGDVITLDDETFPIQTLDKMEDGTVVLDGEVYLVQENDEIYAYYLEMKYTEVFSVLELFVPDTVIFLDHIDPATGDILDEPTKHTAKEFIAMMESGEGPEFDLDNTYITFDENGDLAEINRYYVPWQ